MSLCPAVGRLVLLEGPEDSKEKKYRYVDFERVKWYRVVPPTSWWSKPLLNSALRVAWCFDSGAGGTLRCNQ